MLAMILFVLDSAILKTMGFLIQCYILGSSIKFAKFSSIFTLSMV